MNKCYHEIKQLFEMAGISNFEKLPKDIAEKRKFSKLFKELNKHLEPAKVQGFVWEQLTYEFNTENQGKETYTLDFNEEIYNTLLQRYKELRHSGGGSGEDDSAYDIDPYLMSLSTEKIDSDYMDSRFKKYVKMLNEEVDPKTIETMLNELHRSFASLTQEEQKFANILLKDIQNNDLVVSNDKSIREYITEYQTRAKNDQIHIFALRLGVEEKSLRDIMEKHVTEKNINLFGQYDMLVQGVNIETAKKYFDEIEGTDVPKRKVRSKLDALLRKFILEDGFELKNKEIITNN